MEKRFLHRKKKNNFKQDIGIEWSNQVRACRAAGRTCVGKKQKAVADEMRKHSGSSLIIYWNIELWLESKDLILTSDLTQHVKSWRTEPRFNRMLVPATKAENFTVIPHKRYHGSRKRVCRHCHQYEELLEDYKRLEQMSGFPRAACKVNKQSAKHLKIANCRFHFIFYLYEYLLEYMITFILGNWYMYVTHLNSFSSFLSNSLS